MKNEFYEGSRIKKQVYPNIAGAGTQSAIILIYASFI